ncbi:hypothetical protein [Fodinicurvata fenggangensis]|uniref:hypothetical protein n=1 Tax=Fodinicurvata fenggangensis TaxID=1121830 RepID=UPI000557E1FD|nr:hypothetical protein [Fodinicurvata fenggangensis]
MRAEINPLYNWMHAEIGACLKREEQVDKEALIARAMTDGVSHAEAEDVYEEAMEDWIEVYSLVGRINSGELDEP